MYVAAIQSSKNMRVPAFNPPKNVHPVTLNNLLCSPATVLLHVQ